MTSALFFAWALRITYRPASFRGRRRGRGDAELQPSTENGELLNREPFQSRSVEAIDRSKIGQRG
jgi:hypothetical protein